MRFYPNSLPAFALEPTSDKFAIESVCDKRGEGVISLTHFEPGDIVFAFTGFLVMRVTLYTLQVSKGVHLHDPYFMGKILHACAPNTSCDMEKQVFIAAKEIKPRDILTMDYETVEDELYRPFYCECGSPNCKGLIQGKGIGIQQRQFSALS